MGITILVSLVWVASCCTSFAFNKNDYSKEFGYSTRAVAENDDRDSGASDGAASPPGGTSARRQQLDRIEESENDVIISPRQ